MKTLYGFAFCAVLTLGRKLESNNYDDYDDFKLTEKAFLADETKGTPYKLPILGGLYTKDDKNEFNKFISKSVHAFMPFIKDFTLNVASHFEVAYYTAGRANITVDLPEFSDGNYTSVNLGYNVDLDEDIVIDNPQRDIAIESTLKSISVFKPFCKPPDIAFYNLTASNVVLEGVLFSSELSSPCKQRYSEWKNTYDKVKSIDKYTDCQYVVTSKIKSTNVYVKMVAKLSGMTTGVVKLGAIIENQIPSKLRISVNDKKCGEKKQKNRESAFHITKSSYTSEDTSDTTYICLENAYWKETKFYIKSCKVYDTNATAEEQKQICKAYKKVLSPVNVKSLQSLYNFEFPQKLPKCYSSSKIQKIYKKYK